MTTALETEFYRICNLVSQEELRRNPRAKKKMLQMRQTLSALVRLFNLKKREVSHTGRATETKSLGGI